jgi:predicted MFS family arabinose efflux permease
MPVPDDSSEASGTEDPPAASPAPLRDPGLWLLFSVTVVAVGNVSSVAPSFPRMAEALGVSRVAVGWVVTAYALPGIVSAPIAGVLADRVGRKRVLVPTLVVFGLAGGACALVQSFPLLLALRVVQGAMAAPLVGLAVTMIGDRYNGAMRAAAVGYNASALNVGTALYPAVGGALAAIAWFWPFALPLLALPVAGAVAWRLEVPSLRRAQTLSGYFAIARDRLADRRVVGLLGVNLGVFVLLFGAFITYIPELLDARFGSPSTVAGIVLAAASVSSGLVATQMGRLSMAVAPRRLIQLSLLIDGTALVLMPLAPGPWGVGAAAFLFGVAQGLNQPALQTRLTELTSDASRAVVLSLNGMVLRVGEAVGPLLMGGALLWGGIGAVFYVAAGVAVLTAGGAVYALRPDA